MKQCVGSFLFLFKFRMYIYYSQHDVLVLIVGLLKKRNNSNF